MWDTVLNEGGDSDSSQLEEADQPYRTQLNDYSKKKRVQDLASDSLHYWDSQSGRVNVNLANMVKKYHCPSPDSASAVKLFSAAKHVLGQTRLSMKPANVERSLFLKYGLRR